MSERKTYAELEQIKKEYRVSNIWSWSRFNTYKNCSYEYYLRYIKKVKPDRDDGLYAPSGGAVHNILQDYYENKIKYEDMLPKYEEELMKFNLLGLKYDRSNENKNTAIANKYEYCIRHFFKNHIPIKEKVVNEQFVLIKIEPFLFQGYCDAIHKKDGKIYVTDWKTSTIYTSGKLISEAPQLILYAIALTQLGVPLEKIICRWNFLKYVNIETQLANGKTNSRNIERNQIGNKLASNVKMWLNKSGCTEDEIENYLATMNLTNSIEHLPEEVRSKYVIKDCWVSIDLTQEIIDELKKDIVETLIEITKKELEWEQSKDDKIWWQDVTDKNSYYFSNLCSYSSAIHLPYKQYLEERQESMNKNNSNSFDGKDNSWLDEIM